ncbi:uncharacterized protein CLUP02_00914 [Colletotrichum lupini]|uniref:Uncharacterized protein n=1 Tax=Colletotrichum lupini TaxID=145971 RepID=A0A9Q8SBC0_9PEZI|nr:uncharacterized protein CLUP02_00914 [Colletotrichum lupini]UQC74266.1 hypothetical protein CLUP02_00914 [Colletotrichum lupini]
MSTLHSKPTAGILCMFYLRVMGMHDPYVPKLGGGASLSVAVQAPDRPSFIYLNLAPLAWTVAGLGYRESFPMGQDWWIGHGTTLRHHTTVAAPSAISFLFNYLPLLQLLIQCWETGLARHHSFFGSHETFRAPFPTNTRPASYLETRAA